MGASRAGMSLRHVLVILAGILICLGPCALVYNTWSIFVVPVSSSLGVQSSQFTFFITLIYLIGALAASFAGNLMEKFDLRVILGASVVLVAGGMACCSFWTEIWQFYISGIIEGLGIVSLMFLAVPTLINRWFAIRTGFFIGLCLSMSGIGGAIWSMVGGIVFSISDWHFAYVVFAGIVLLLGLPASVLFIRSYPSEVGLSPYGSKIDSSVESTLMETDDGKASQQATSGSPNEKEKQWGVAARVMFRSPVFFSLALTMGIFNSLTVVGNLFASYIYHLGDIGLGGITADGAIMLASGVASCIMIVSAIAKVGLGALSDKNMIIAIITPCACGAISILCMWFGVSISMYFVYAGGLLFGVLYAAIDALGAAITRQLTGPRDYTLIYSRVAIFVNIAGAGAATLFAAVSEISWETEWIMALVLMGITLALGIYTVVAGKKLEQTYE